MLFLINEQKKKTRLWGKWLCRVFMIDYWKTEPNQFHDITETIAKKLWREKQFDWVNLTIHYWSGTGNMIISEQLKKDFWDDIVIKDVSIFD